MKSPAAQRLSEVMKNFPGVRLLPGFHVHWRETVHVPLNEGLDPLGADGRLAPGYFEEVARRAFVLLSRQTDADDELILVMNGYPARPGVIGKYLKHPKLKYRMDSGREIWHDGEERIPVCRLILPCRKGDVRWRPLLCAISGRDFAGQPRLRHAGSLYPPDVFVVNETKRSIFHMYDDRGVDLFKQSTE
ncbi:DUF3885 domain-containing protein [Edaphobacillus lindanitolerans]|uniref:DUF3885 domain-containing protein n=1 Tax=Edaphobacillus lindanitolerans TaxID=550447 RepID=A0A1U7PT87_9BACI|nr:DUF3885 domain-containing protein [Edaphobacillus lindanitolerans]SIT92903.1 protein of unknown function [Edaphobacillus lindanitolerans]